jgi:DNA-binding PadR family transcriptional regulator
LIKNDLVKVDQETYYPTLFGAKLNELTTNSFDLETILPPHSECYEETVLSSLASEPKTYEDLKGTISPVNLARVISRLQKTRLVETSKEKDYVFFFTTKRNPAKGQLSQTEKKIYGNIPETGISAKKIAERAKISVRRTYKYLRRLKGKKMVFSRKKPKLYTLTDRGLQTATILKEICDLAYQIPAIASRLVKAGYASGPEVEVSRMESAEDNVSIPITVMRRTRLNHPLGKMGMARALTSSILLANDQKC